MSKYLNGRLLKVIKSMCHIKPMSDDAALLEGIKVQNEKYEKLLAFVKIVADESVYEKYENLNELNWVAFSLLKEIGE